MQTVTIWRALTNNLGLSHNPWYHEYNADGFTYHNDYDIPDAFLMSGFESALLNPLLKIESIEIQET